VSSREEKAGIRVPFKSHVIECNLIDETIREFETNGDFVPSIIEPASPDGLTITVGQLSNLTRHTLPRRVNDEKLVCENQTH
jgi:hypothetical protein